MDILQNVSSITSVNKKMNHRYTTFNHSQGKRGEPRWITCQTNGRHDSMCSSFFRKMNNIQLVAQRWNSPHLEPPSCSAKTNILIIMKQNKLNHIRKKLERESAKKAKNGDSQFLCLLSISVRSKYLLIMAKKGKKNSNPSPSKLKHG